MCSRERQKRDGGGGQADGASEQRSEWKGAKERNKMQIKEKQQISLVLSTIK